jgi:predicted amidohydrolase YtcJ
MQEEVAKLVAQMDQIPFVESFDDFVCFFDETMPQGPVCLPAIPRAVAAETPYDADQFLNVGAWDRGVALFHTAQPSQISGDLQSYKNLAILSPFQRSKGFLMNRKVFAVVGAVILMAAGMWWMLRPARVDMLLLNGNVYTVNAQMPRAEAVAIKHGIIVGVGTSDEVRRCFSGDTVIDLHGRSLYPGFVDAHAHLEGLGIALMTVDLVGMRSVHEVQSRIAEEIALTGGRSWIRGRGWDQNLWPAKVFPHHADLDAVSMTVPIFLVRIDGHALWVNRKVLELAGITRFTPDPSGGRIVRDGDGEPTGVFVDNAMDPIRALLPPPSVEERTRAITLAVQACVRVGLVGVHDMGVDEQLIGVYKEMIARRSLPFRVYAAIDGVGRTWDHYRSSGPETNIGDGRLTVRALKLYADGALGSRGAALIEPYSDDPGNRGLTVMSSEAMRTAVQQAVERGFQVCTHAIGDRANAMTLSVYEEVLASTRRHRDDLRLRIEHAQVLDSSDIPRFAALGVIPSMQPSHCTSDMPWAVSRLGPVRIRHAYAWRSLLATGVIIPAGSDFPVEAPNPLWGFYAAITRQDRSGYPDSGWYPEQRMSRLEALKAYTLWPAVASFREKDAGTIERGKWADLVVLSRDIMDGPPSEVLRTDIVLTIVAGQVVFRLPEARPQ